MLVIPFNLLVNKGQEAGGVHERRPISSNGEFQVANCLLCWDQVNPYHF